jgi:enoyl-CoA hydratase
VASGHGDNFTAGLDLMDVLPAIAEDGPDRQITDPDDPDPWAFIGEPCSKPVVVAAHGRCYTLGVELMLASAVAVASPDTIFVQLEVARGIFPLGGGAPRLATQCGKVGMKWLLTGEEFSASQALDAGLLTEITEPGQHLDRAMEIANQIAANAPLGVQASLAATQAYEKAARLAAQTELNARASKVLTSSDATEGMTAMIERREPRYQGN